MAENLEPTIPQDNSNANEKDGNWVKEHRAILEHKIFQCPYLYKMWRFLVMKARWEDGEFSDGAVKFPVKRGQVVASLSFLMKGLNYTKSKSQSKQQTLRKLNAIKSESIRGYTVITICNYDKYQCTNNNQKSKPIRKKISTYTPKNLDPVTTKEYKTLTNEEGKNLTLSGGTPGGLVWDSYSKAYAQKYGTNPTRNAKANSLCSQFAKRVPNEDAPMVIAFYLTHGDRWYVQKCHALEYAIKDAEKLHMEWKMGSQMTTSIATTLERQSANDKAIADHLRRKYGK